MKARVVLLAMALAGALSGSVYAADAVQPTDPKVVVAVAATVTDPSPRYCVYINGDGTATLKYDGASNGMDDKSKPCAIPVYPNELPLAFGFFLFH
ncbi:MAG: hypothetical protein HY243_01315 [Proteobacteria bacterium]|nr:hypothetical protein [Pseudomonadota bacterium]